MSRRSIAIVDYGVSNLFSVQSALQYVAPHSCIQVTDAVDQLQQADAIVFPGQGAARVCMRNLQRQATLVDTLRQLIVQKPFLGICMGLQVLLERSAENGGVDCLGILSGEVKAFNAAQLKVPHMGWNTIKQNEHPLWHNIADNSYFYFVHSYYAQANAQQQVFGVTHYGVSFSSALGYENLFAMQAHPEKSGEVGLQLLR